MDDNTLADIWKHEPLARFSVYSQIQVQALWSLANEISELLNESIRDGMFYAGQKSNVTLIYGRFWLWVLGAYEVTRTMSQHPACFSARHNAEVKTFKKKIATLRMPFAKLEFSGNKGPINSEASIHSMDSEARDLSFRVGEEVVSMRALMGDFARFTKLLTPDDVLHDLRRAPGAIAS